MSDEPKMVTMSLEDFARRTVAMAQEFSRPPLKPVSEMTDSEREAAFEELCRPKPYASPLPADLAGKHVADMTEAERRRAAQALGINLR